MDPFETKVTLRVVRASAGDPLLQICMRIMVGVAVGAIVVTWIVGIESMGEFPFIGKAIVIGVGWAEGEFCGEARDRAGLIGGDEGVAAQCCVTDRMDGERGGVGAGDGGSVMKPLQGHGLCAEDFGLERGGGVGMD